MQITMSRHVTCIDALSSSNSRCSSQPRYPLPPGPPAERLVSQSLQLWLGSAWKSCPVEGGMLSHGGYTLLRLLLLL